MLTAPRVSGSRGPQKGVLQGEIISPSIFGLEQTVVAVESIELLASPTSGVGLIKHKFKPIIPAYQPMRITA